MDFMDDTVAPTDLSSDSTRGSSGLKHKKSCRTCVTKKVKCDGQFPCGTCSTANSDGFKTVCTYDIDKRSLPATRKPRRKPRTTITTTCIPCISRKSKCNHEVPCSMCTLKGTRSTCEYDPKYHLRRTRAGHPATSDGSSLTLPSLSPEVTADGAYLTGAESLTTGPITGMDVQPFLPLMSGSSGYRTDFNSNVWPEVFDSNLLGVGMTENRSNWGWHMDGNDYPAYDPPPS